MHGETVKYNINFLEYFPKCIHICKCRCLKGQMHNSIA